MTPEIKKWFYVSLSCFAILELLSFWGWLDYKIGAGFFILAILVTFIVSLKNIYFGVILVLGELLIGSLGGGLLSINISSFNLPLRVGVFMVVMLAWILIGIWQYLKIRNWQDNQLIQPFLYLKNKRLFWPFVAVLTTILFGVTWGAINSNGLKAIIFDANGYLYITILPLVLSLLDQKMWRERFSALLLSSVLVSTIKSFFVLYIFSHRLFGWAAPIYLWVRDTRVGEITLLSGDFYRVFFQSQIFSILAFFMLFFILVDTNKDGSENKTILNFAVFGLALAGILLGLSRSFWLGMLIAGLLILVILIRYKMFGGIFKRSLLLVFGGLCFSFALIFMVSQFPYPKTSGQSNLLGVFGQRASVLNGEVAIDSRLNLLPKLMTAIQSKAILGYGFGKTITYESKDPRVLAANKTAVYTTYTFEWGYLDFLIKFGLVGTLGYLWFFGVVLKHVLKNIAAAGKNNIKTKLLVNLGFFGVLATLFVTHIFSPYFNHPLGIGLVMVVAGFVFSSDLSQNTAI